MNDDALLIELSQQGDRNAFDALIRKYEARAYQYAYRLTSNTDEASDIVADAFVRVYNALKNFRGQSSFGTWLYRILTNCYLDQRKKERSRRHESLEATMNLEGGEVHGGERRRCPRRACWPGEPQRAGRRQWPQRVGGGRRPRR